MPSEKLRPIYDSNEPTCSKCGLNEWSCIRKQATRFTGTYHSFPDGKLFRWKTWTAWRNWSICVWRSDPTRVSTATAFWESMHMRDDMKDVQKERGKWEMHPEPMFAKCPNINQYLSDCYYDDGRERELASLSIRLCGDQVSVSLTEQARERTMTTNAKTVREAIEAMEKHIATNGPAWRNWGGKKRRSS